MGFLFLLPSNHSDGSTVFEDASPYARTITLSGSVYHDTAVGSPFSGISSAIYFEGSDDYLTAPFAETFGTADFCIDFWWRQATNPEHATWGQVICLYAGSAPFISLSCSTTGGAMAAAAVSSQWDTFQNISLGTTDTSGFHHYALTRASGIFYGFRDGVLKSVVSGKTGSSFNSFQYTRLGKFGASGTTVDVKGWLSECAVRDEAIWDGSGYGVNDTVFTPPSAPYMAAQSNPPITLSPLGGSRIITNVFGR